MKNTIRNMRVLLKDMNNYTARSNLMWDSAMAENGVLKVGRKTDFEVHQIEHQLGAYTDCNHGQGLAVLHPVYYKHIYKTAAAKFARFAVNVWNVKAEKSDEETALRGIDALSAFIKECGLPTRLLDLKMKADPKTLLTPETLKAIADSCNIMTGACYKTITREEILEVLKESL
jgi:alcohol dehydrogenase YqhD (iron-dependent ADH family)